MNIAYEAVIGLEIHSELKTDTKMFCASHNDPDEKHPNVNVCPVCLAHPGTLPVINKKAVELVQSVGAALKCRLAEFSKFDRKNYFYPDLPKGYQISQYDLPLCGEGHLEIIPEDTKEKKQIRIERIHLEEDTGRLLHPDAAKESYVDFNRAGVPLMELVTKPDIRSAKEARAFAEELQLILKYLGASDANMEKGQMRVEVNLSLRKVGTEKFGTKEEAHDYRYFPEPDLPPMRFSAEYFDTVRAMLPELPAKRRNRLISEYDLSPQDAEVFVIDREMGDYFEQVISELRAWYEADDKEFDASRLIKLTTNYMLSDLRGIIVAKSSSIGDLLIKQEDFAELIKLIAQDKLSSRAAKDVLSEMFGTGADPHEIIKEKNIGQTSDEGEIGTIIDQILIENPKVVEDIKSGKPNATQFLIGKVMAVTRGKANPKVVKELLDKKTG